MMHIRFLPIITAFLLFLGVLGGLPYLRASESTTELSVSSDVPEALHSHVLRLAQENCAIDLDIRTEPTTPEEQSALMSCAQQELQSFRGNPEEVREALIRKILEVGNKRIPKSLPDFVNTETTYNYFQHLTQEDARVLYHDLINCYFTIATNTTIEFYLNKAMGVADTDALSDTKMTKREYYQIPEPPEHYCFSVYDTDPLLHNTYEERMSTFQEALNTSVRESQNKETNTGFTSLIGQYALDDLENYLYVLDIFRTYPNGSHLVIDGEERNTFRSFVYRPEQATVSILGQVLQKEEASIRSQANAAEHNLKAALRAFQSFERTFPIHLQYKKIQYTSERLASRVRYLRLAWKFLNVKFTNASIEGGAK